jgi:hypothetical protein
VSGPAGAIRLIDCASRMSRAQRTRLLFVLGDFPLNKDTRLAIGARLAMLIGYSDADRSAWAEFRGAEETPDHNLSPIVDVARAIVAYDGETVDPAGQLLGEDPLEQAVWTDVADISWMSALGRLDPYTAGAVVTNLIERVSDRRSHERAGNRLMAIVEALPPGYRVPVKRLAAKHLSTAGGLTDAQFAFAIARADLDDVFTGFARLLGAISASYLDSVLGLLAEVAEQTRAHEGPVLDADAPWPPRRRDGAELAFWRDLGLGLNIGRPPRKTRYVIVPTSDARDAPPPQQQLQQEQQQQQQQQQQQSQRTVLVDVSLPSDDGSVVALEKAFVIGRRHKVAVWIGHMHHAGESTISSGAGFAEDAVQQDPGRFTELTVTLGHLDEAESKPLYHPNDQATSSQPCEFDLTVGLDESIVCATIAVSQQNRVLQQFALLGNAVTASRRHSGSGKIRLNIQVLARSPEHDNPPSHVDVSIVRPRGNAPHVLLQDGEASVVSPWAEGLRRTVEIVAGRLYDAAYAAATGDGQTAWHDLLRLLAAQGTQVHSWLRDNGYGALDTAEIIQLLDADPTQPLPIEVVYDRGGVTSEAVPCAEWSNALATGSCANCPVPKGAFRSPHICPMGFWGLKKVIERQTGTGVQTPPGRLEPLTSVMFAASGNVLEGDYNTTRNVLKRAKFPKLTVVTKWEKWTGLIKRAKPTLIVMLPHQDYDATLEMDYLEIGQNSQLRSGELTDEYIRAPDGPFPVVLLLGCRTATASVSYQNFVSAFRSNGAPIVVGTLATVLGRDAAPIAQQFVNQLIGLRAKDTEPQRIRFGETMRAVRRRMVGAQNVAALGLIAFGDSDWEVGV